MQKQITILGRSYTLRADEGDEIELAATEVDRRMRELSARAPAFDATTVALLTALNLASEARNLRKRLRSRIEEIDHRAAGAEAVLEAALADDGGPDSGP